MTNITRIISQYLFCLLLFNSFFIKCNNPKIDTNTKRNYPVTNDTNLLLIEPENAVILKTIYSKDLSLTDSFYERKVYEKAIPLYKQQINFYLQKIKKLNDREYDSLITCIKYLSDCFANQADIRVFLNYSKNLQATFNNIKVKGRYFRGDLILLDAELFLSNVEFKRAASLAANALKVFIESDDSIGIVQAYLFFAHIEKENGNSERSKEFLLKSIYIGEQCNDFDNLGKAYLNLAIFYGGSSDSSLYYYKKIENIYTRINNILLKARYINWMAIYYGRNSKLQTAIIYFLESDSLLNQIKPKNNEWLSTKATIVKNLGLAYFKSGIGNKADFYFKISLLITKDLLMTKIPAERIKSYEQFQSELSTYSSLAIIDSTFFKFYFPSIKSLIAEAINIGKNFPEINALASS